VYAAQEEVLRSEHGRLYRLPLGTPVDDLELRQQFRPALVELLDRHESHLLARDVTHSPGTLR
jgi:hypothetical protein